VHEALELIQRVKPQRAYLTHMSHRIGLHAEAEERLPDGVKFAYDGLKVEINE
jgi:phosphoribosyl 1,2-cyclic phosphate phosphodiesterase